jgi:hypothetical protein
MTFIEKRHVRGIAVTNTFDDNGGATEHRHEFHDYVPVDILDAYVADAKTKWQDVRVVSDEHDPGPAGDEGLTHYPAHLSEGHPHQGATVDQYGNHQEG